MMKSSRRHQVGATLLEALAFLGIAAIVVVGAISMFRAAQGSAQAKDMVSQLNGIRSSVKTLYATQAASCAGCLSLINAELLAAKAFPDTLRTNPPIQVFNMWAGPVLVRAGDISAQTLGAASDGYSIQYRNVPQEICLKVAPQIGGSWVGLTINGNPFVSTDVEAFPVATASAQCTAGSSNGLTFYFN